MKALIDIKTPAGKSLEGFPFKHDPTNTDIGNRDGRPVFYAYKSNNTYSAWTLHSGDKITIEIL